MKFNKEKNELIDFLFSFVQIKSWEKEDKVFEKIKDDDYIGLVNAYEEKMAGNWNRIYGFVGMDFNLVFDMCNLSKVNNIGDFLDFLKDSGKEDMQEAINKSYNFKDGLDLKGLESLDIEDGSRWKILYAYESYDKEKDGLIKDLEGAYEDYRSYRKIFLDSYEKVIKDLVESLEAGRDRDLLYAYLGEAIKNYRGFDFVIGLFSFNAIRVWEKEKLISFGLYSLKYFEELEKAKTRSLKETEEVIKALADPTRYKILKSIKSGINSNKVLATSLDISPAGVSYQLKSLRDANLIFYDSSSKKYRVNNDLIKAAINNIELDFSL